MTDGKEGRDLVVGDLMEARRGRHRRLEGPGAADGSPAASEQGVLLALPPMPPTEGETSAGELAEERPVGSLPAQETAGAGVRTWVVLGVALALFVIVVRLLAVRKGSHG